MSIDANTLASTPFISNNNNNFFGLGVHPINEDIYVADALDFVQSGIVFRYSSTASLINQFTVGIIPGRFSFIL